MTLTALLLLGVVVGCNNLAVALTLGALGQNDRRYRVMFVFGVFEFSVAFIGLWFGGEASRLLPEGQAQLIGGFILVGLGAFTILGGLHESDKDEEAAERLTRWTGLIFLAAGLSIDNLLVGFSLGLGNANPLIVASTIAGFSIVFTWVGIHVGSRARRYGEQTAKVSAGVVLVVLGVVVGFGWM